MEAYGQELILDLHKCWGEHNKASICGFCIGLCDAIDITAEDFHVWSSLSEESKDPKTFGISAIHFIITSNITVHWLPLRCGGSLLLNVFSCKPFDDYTVREYTRKYFGGTVVQQRVLERY